MPRRCRLSRAGNRCRLGEAIRVACVYLLRCADDTLYCGWTTDVRRRLAAHRSGTASRYTRSRRPVELAAVISVADRSTALREEARIKRLSRAAKLQLIAASTSPRGLMAARHCDHASAATVTPRAAGNNASSHETSDGRRSQ